MKTPEEIKKGLEACTNDAYECSKRCPYFNALSNGVDCAANMHADALAYIQQLEEERDALLDYLAKSTCAPCDICKHDVDGSGVMGCKRIREVGLPCFEWIGLDKRERKNETD